MQKAKKYNDNLRVGYETIQISSPTYVLFSLKIEEVLSYSQ